jgi:hypothetical protein
MFMDKKRPRMTKNWVFKLSCESARNRMSLYHIHGIVQSKRFKKLSTGTKNGCRTSCMREYG